MDNRNLILIREPKAETLNSLGIYENRNEYYDVYYYRGGDLIYLFESHHVASLEQLEDFIKRVLLKGATEQEYAIEGKELIEKHS